jgi:glycosyltransferase involved in cell wall biosynthesis
LSDDFSNDGSEKIAKKLSEEYEFITYIRSSKNKGKGSALNNAKDYIETSHVVIHDADLEYFPSDIVEMYEVSRRLSRMSYFGY